MEAWPQTSDSSSPWRHGRNFWFFFFSMEAWPQTSNPLAILRKLLKTSNPTLFQTSYENFSKLPILHSSNPLAILRKLLTKTSNSSTFGYENLKLPILSQTSISSNLKTWKISTFGYETSQTSQNFLRKLLTKTSQNFQSYTLPILHFWLRKPETSSSSNLKTWKTSNPTLFLQLPILHFWTKTWNFRFLHFWLRKLETSSSSNLKTWKTSNPTLFLQLPIPPLLVTKTWNFQSSRKLLIPPTWKLEKPPILHSSYNFQSSPTWTLMKSWFSATFPPKCVFWTKLGGFPQFFFFFFFLTKWTFLQNFNPQKVPKMFIILLFLVLLLLQTFPTFWTISTFCLFQTPKSAYFLQ